MGDSGKEILKEARRPSTTATSRQESSSSRTIKVVCDDEFLLFVRYISGTGIRIPATSRTTTANFCRNPENSRIRSLAFNNEIVSVAAAIGMSSRGMQEPSDGRIWWVTVDAIMLISFADWLANRYLLYESDAVGQLFCVCVEGLDRVR